MTRSASSLDDAQFDACKPEARADRLIRWYGNEAVAWSPVAAMPVHLDPLSALVVQMLDGSATVADIVTDVHDVLGVPRSVARDQLRRAVSRLDQGGLLTTSTEVPADDMDFFPGPPNP